ncbi:hypothetical protein [Brevibacterium atlanticum]|uniref:hypothetical protein n=1 Tax=Brevibacterium atlanticum TaxID=2697563 RepID=UPI001420AA2B|nr:hypothetical protein [Brevibacterium atlanticum]
MSTWAKRLFAVTCAAIISFGITTSPALAKSAPATAEPHTTAVKRHVAKVWWIYADGFHFKSTCEAYAYKEFRHMDKEGTRGGIDKYDCLDAEDGTWEMWVFGPDGVN